MVKQAVSSIKDAKVSRYYKRRSSVLPIMNESPLPIVNRFREHSKNGREKIDNIRKATVAFQ